MEFDSANCGGILVSLCASRIRSVRNMERASSAIVLHFHVTYNVSKKVRHTD